MVCGLPRDNEQRRAAQSAPRAISQRPPDARITGGFTPILLNCYWDAKWLLMATQTKTAAHGAASRATISLSGRVKPPFGPTNVMIALRHQA